MHPASSDSSASAASSVVEYMAAGGVVIHNGAVLLLDRPARNEIRLPKGHVDPGESDDVTALRETVEETGYAELEIVHDLGSKVVEYDFRGTHFRRTEHYYLMRLTGERQVERPPVDAAGFRPFWASLDDAELLLTYTAEQETLRTAVAAHTAHGDGATA